MGTADDQQDLDDARQDLDENAVVLRDPAAIKALAHPARMAVIDRLYAGDVLTATECAELAGLSPSAMSYHLRALERWGLITRAEASEDGRERPWRALGKSVRIDPAGSRAASAASGLLIDQMIASMRAEVLRNAELRGLDAPAASPAGFSFTPATMTDEEARALYDELDRLTRRYRERPDAPPDARRHHIWWYAVPVDTLTGGRPAPPPPLSPDPDPDPDRSTGGGT